ncbi:MAG TPA: hypothetical protein VLH40_05685 [Atribacteraceae bacterium]|nr:hypothetical protein [Atribacteraceae bacterium]
MGQCQREPGPQKLEIDLRRLQERIQVLLPLIRGWNPDVLVALNPDGLVMSGLLNRYLQRDVEVLNVGKRNGEYTLLLGHLEGLAGKRALLVAGRLTDESLWAFVESALQKQQILSVCRLIALGKGVEYSCFPEYSEDTPLPWEDR